MAKIRVMCSDPFATDSSSDDESLDYEKPANRKLFVQEISAAIPPSTPISTIHLDYLAKSKSDSSSGKDESKSVEEEEVEEEKVPRNCIVLALPALKPGDIPTKSPGMSRLQNILKNLSLSKKSSSGNSVNQIAKSHRRVSDHPGLRLTATGRWGVKIRHPLRKTQVWLGTYDTFDEASKLYNEKKLEFASLRPARPEPKKHHRNEFSRKRKLRFEEAAESYKRKKIGLAEAKRKGKHKRERLVIEGVTVHETASGKWGAYMVHPKEKRKVWLGSYPTPEEAAESYKRKNLGFDSTSNRDSTEKDSSMQVDTSLPVTSKKLNCPGLKFNTSEKDSSIQVDTCVPVTSKKLNCPGLKFNTSGEWEVTIQHPIRLCVLHLGLYSSFELAAEAYDKKKAELDKLHHDVKACLAAENEETQTPTGPVEKKYTGVRATSSGRWSAQINDPFSHKSKVYLGSYNTPEEAANAFKRKRRELDLMCTLVKKRKQEKSVKVVRKQERRAKPKYKKLGAIDAENSTLTAVNSQDSQGSNNKNDENQTPNFSLPTEHLYEGVIDSYGQLVGEYSKIDDELWFDRPGDDGGAIGGVEDLVWDQKPSPSELMTPGILLNDDKVGI